MSYTLICRWTLSLGLAGMLLGCSNPPPVASPSGTPPVASSSPTPAAPVMTSTPSPVSLLETITNAEAGLELAVPSGWKKSEDGSQLTSPDETARVLIMVVPEADFAKASLELVTLLGEALPEAKLTGPGTSGETNGLKTFSTQGTCKPEGKDCQFELTMVAGKKVAVMMLLGEKAAVEAQSETFAQLKQSIKAAE